MLTIKSRAGEYTVEFVDTFSKALASFQLDEHYFTLIDEQFSDLYQNHLEGLDSSKIFRIKANEENKSYEAILPIFEALIEKGIRRDSRLLVIGGGVLQDIGAFVAHLLLRGIQWYFIPTTLLAQADSCIGSKSSINVGPYKNQLGTYDPPKRIVLPADVLKTLTPDDIRSGLGEIIKLHALEGEPPITELKTYLPNASAEMQILQSLIRASLEIKKRYIEEDEFDQGIRNLLNYGHTFGHAYESATQYAIPHGIAVTLGMLTAVYVSEHRGMLPSGTFAKEQKFLEPFYTPFEMHLTVEKLSEILAALQRDKKNTNGRVNCILTRGYGRMEKVSLNAIDDLQLLLKQFLNLISVARAASE